jgi:hypothetical protein
VNGQVAHSLAEVDWVDWEMKATVVLFVLLALAAAAFAAQPVNPVAGLTVATVAMEPAWMILCGASLLVLASVVRRFLP